jgi:SagB-type dehydrogenase family enzyme
MSVAETMRIRRDATAERDADGQIALVEGHIRMPFSKLGPALGAALDALAAGETTEEQLEELAVEAEGEDALMRLQLLLRRLDATGWIERSVTVDGKPLATLQPAGHDLAPVLRVLDPAQPVVLSRFALLRVDGGQTVLETPKASIRLVLHDPRLVGLIPLLAAPVAPAALDAASLGLSQQAMLAFLRLLSTSALLVRPDEEESFELEQWSFPDLLEHARSRVGRNLGDYGGSYRFEGRFDPVPAVRTQFEPFFALEKPDLEATANADLPFTRVLERRRSIRIHDGEHPLTAAQLGEFLYRAARLRERFHDGKQELSSRPYPSGGAAYELELYPLVRQVDGTEPALYHYDPEAHTLGLVAEPGPRTTLLLEYARFTALMETQPQVVILIAARFGRVTWKYESMAYALVLKHVGVLLQTMYLVATAMGLAPCALGGGNSDAFAAATGLDYYAEPAVGEFILGSRLPSDAT